MHFSLRWASVDKHHPLWGVKYRTKTERSTSGPSGVISLSATSLTSKYHDGSTATHPQLYGCSNTSIPVCLRQRFHTCMSATTLPRSMSETKSYANMSTTICLPHSVCDTFPCLELCSLWQVMLCCTVHIVLNTPNHFELRLDCIKSSAVTWRQP